MAALIPRTRFQAIKRQNICAVSAAVQVFYYSQQIRIIKNPTTANLKRGSGGRCSFNGIVCTIFGNTGFIGTSLTSQLGRIGTQLILPYRDMYDSLRLKLCGDLGQILFHPFHLRDEESIRQCVKYSDVVINLIGRDWETKNFTFNDVHVEGAARIARICKESGVEKFIHVSCLNANSHPQPILLSEGSKFLKSKWEGECEVRKEFSDAIIIRPSVTYGTSDRFIRAYTSRWRMHLKGIPLYKKGEETEKQPIYVNDVAAGIVAAVLNPDTNGRTYQFVGPHRYKLSTLIDWFAKLKYYSNNPFLTHEFHIKDINKNPLYKLKIAAQELFSVATPLGYLHWEALEMENTSDKVIEGVPTIEDLGIQPIPVDDQIPIEMKPLMDDTEHYYDFERIIIDPPTPVETKKDPFISHY